MPIANQPEKANVILVVEDRVADRLLLKKSLEAFVPAGVSIETAENGREALDKSQVLKPRLILLDLSMPIMDGFEFLERRLEDPELRRIPVIATSPSEKGVSRAYDLGASGYVKKPIGRQEIERFAKALTAFWVEVAEVP